YLDSTADGFDELFPTLKGGTIVGVGLCRIFLGDAQFRGGAATSHVRWFIGVIAPCPFLVLERHEGLEHGFGGLLSKNSSSVAMVKLFWGQMRIPGSIRKVLREVILAPEAIPQGSLAGDVVLEGAFQHPIVIVESHVELHSNHAGIIVS